MIHHVTRPIPPATLDQCIEFYGLVGFTPVPVPPGIAGRAVWLERKAGGIRTQIHLAPSDEAVPEQGHVGLVVEPYDRTLQALRDAGHEVEPRRAHWGSPRAYVHDPAGNLVELMSWPPGGP